MIVASGVTCAVGFGALAVLMLGLHAQIRRLTRMAEAVQASLQANLKEVLLEGQSPQATPPAPVPAPPAPPYAEAPPPVARLRPHPPVSLAAHPELTTDSPSVIQLAAATTEAEPEPMAAPLPALRILPPPASEEGFAETTAPPQDLATRWNPDRRLLVMRLAARGNRADQIAAALRIPLEEIELFLKLNKLVKNEAFVEAVRSENPPAD